MILIRSPKPRTARSAEGLAAVLTAGTDWTGLFSVIEPGRIRQRTLARP